MFIFRARGRPVENDTTEEIRRKRIPSVVCKTLLGFAHFRTGPTAAVTHNGAFFNGGDPP